MSAEHRQYVPEDLGKPEVTVKFAPSITVNQLLGRTVKDAKGLSLTQTPSNMFKVERLGSASLEYGAVIPFKIDGVGLLSFLNAIAPAKAFGKEGILDDWIMPDQEGQKERLERHEKALGENWEAFEKSREVFMETLLFDPRLQGQKGARQFTRLVSMNYEMPERFAQSALSPKSPRELQKAFVSFIKQRHGIRDRKWVGEESVESTRERASKWDYWRLTSISESFIVRALGSGDRAIQESVANHCNSTLGDDRKTSLEVVDGKVIMRVGKLLRGEVVFTLTPHRKKTWDFCPETVASANYLLPTVRWKKDANGDRRWILDFLDEQLGNKCSRFVDPLPDDIQFDTRRFNPLIGLATIPYFIPSLRKDWPEYQALRKDEAIPAKREVISNPMGPAQVLVLAAQRKEDSLRSEYFDVAEEHIERHAAY